MANEYVKLWCSYEAYFEPLSETEVGRLVLAMLKFKAQGTEPVLSGNERFVWPAIRRDIAAQNEAQAASAEKSRANGALGGRPRKPGSTQKPRGFSENPQEPGKPQGKGQGQGQGQGQKELSAESGKQKFGEFENVLLAAREQEKLVDSLGDLGASEYIERLSVYLAQTGRRYKSHYAAILSWWRKDGKPVNRTPGARVIKPDVGREITPEMTAEELF